MKISSESVINNHVGGGKLAVVQPNQAALLNLLIELLPI